MSVSVFTNNVSFSLCVGDNDNQATQKRNARSKHNSKLDPVTVHGEADVDSLLLEKKMLIIKVSTISRMFGLCS